ncbi:hypothetical protein PHYPSEUDO_014118 [Phytophthora pseudosyringae]|uniref:FYVE-type domain-containing protein n=1 Tax=Phytophthora pseudosyringae TaxID=221518 RepID=A0A8T1W5L4_9STRA|nr:hypothetical protein PHYPSEUDO_014118 [Phytophthora pseudosyringae]
MTASRSLFQPIALSTTDVSELQGVAKTILDANFNGYQHFSDVDPKAWKSFKVKDGMRVYSGRRGEQTRCESELQSLLCVGSTPGTLNSMMSGLLESSTSSETSSAGDFSDAAVLLPIKTPTVTDPFTSVTLKWMELDVRRRSMGLVRNRDYIFVESIGIKHLPSGERVGYRVMHSVGIPKAPVLPGRVRSTLSVCSFFRQVSDTSVSICCMAVIDRTSRQVVVSRFVKALLSTFKPNRVDPVMKSTQSLSKPRSVNGNCIPPTPAQNCITCAKRVWRLAKFARRHSTCMNCHEYVCNSCKIEKKLKLPASNQQVTQRKVTICLSCLTDLVAANESKSSIAKNVPKSFCETIVLQQRRA